LAEEFTNLPELGLRHMADLSFKFDKTAFSISLLKEQARIIQDVRK
jgi:hypothetical protein